MSTEAVDASTWRIFGGLLAVSVCAALVPVLMPALDLTVSGYFLQPNPPLVTKDWWWVDGINEYTPAVFRTIVVLCLIGWMVVNARPHWRRWALPVAFVGLAIFIGPGLLVSSVKELTLRARPFHVTEFGGDRQFSRALQRSNQCDDNCAFVSGHSADGFFLAGLMLLHRRRRWAWACAGVVGGLVVGFARVSVGAHWLSDVLWAMPVTLIGSALAWLFLSRIYRTDLAD
jgi:lipid A 4'-phosphatase